MDPNANLAEQRDIIARMLDGNENSDYLTDAQRLAELVRALDVWLWVGGALPKAWAGPGKGRR